MRLSICIPTKNFGAYIAKTLDSVLNQNIDGIQIVILDSGSTDNTKDIVTAYQAKHPNIDYHYEDKAEGIDKAIAKVISLADAPYCWLLSADDALTPNALKEILTVIDTSPNVILCNRLWCDKELNVIRPEHWRTDTNNTQSISFADTNALTYYLDTSKSIGALFSFMSCIGLKKSAWYNAQLPSDYTGTNYAHVPKLLEMSKVDGGLTYINTPLILCRSGNDSFRTDGLLGRMLIDLRAYYRFGQDLFPQNPTIQTAFYKVMMREHGYKRWVKAFLLSSSPEQKDTAVKLLQSFGYHTMFCKFLSLLNRLNVR